MLYRPVKGSTPEVTLFEAVKKGISPDSALYLPVSLPRIPRAFFNNISGMSLQEIGYVCANILFGSDIPADRLKKVIDRTMTFELPFVETAGNMFTLDLTKGPTHNYNDLCAMFLARFVEEYRTSDRLNVVVATSDNVGNAVAQAFCKAAGVTTYVVFPAGSLSNRRFNELIDYGPNVVPVEVGGAFTDCQNLVREVILDREIQESATTLLANSSNVAILLPRVVYFFYANARLAALGRPLENVVIATPTENLGNLTAAVIARKMGMPVSRFIALLQNDTQDASDMVNESRLTALLSDENDEIKIYSPETHPLVDDEICITMLTDDPAEHDQAVQRQRSRAVKHRIVRIAPSAAAMKRVMLTR